MIVSLKEQLSEAKKGGYAVGLFNVVSRQMLDGVFMAAEQTSSPLIIGIAEVMLPHLRLNEFIAMAKDRAEKAPFPVTLHFDHAHNEDNIIAAMELGFNSIMYDCSELPFLENCERLKAMTKKAHDMGVCVEAELGSVAGIEGDDGFADADSSVFTSPILAKEYIARTNADALAVSIGNAHGSYKGKPELHFDILEEITKFVDTPLVLHGGSGIPEEDFRRAISMGITKVNIFTDINKAAARAAYEGYTEGGGFTKLAPKITEAVRKEAAARMNFFKNR